MKTKLLFILLLLTGLFMQCQKPVPTLPTQSPSPTLHLETAGTLLSLIAENMKYEITDLTLTGNLDSRDIRYIREMAGRDYYGKLTTGKLTVLNLAGATIVASSDYYLQEIHGCIIDVHNTSDNTISDYMFSLCTGLTSVTLPNSVTYIGGSAFSGFCIPPIVPERTKGGMFPQAKSLSFLIGYDYRPESEIVEEFNKVWNSLTESSKKIVSIHRKPDIVKRQCPRI
jgi:hypothetical protein